jgi:hypothetical protein
MNRNTLFTIVHRVMVKVWVIEYPLAVQRAREELEYYWSLVYPSQSQPYWL